MLSRGSEKRGPPNLFEALTPAYPYMGTCQNDWFVTGTLAHTRYMGYVTEGGSRDIPKGPAEDMKAAREGVRNRLAFQGACNRGLVVRNATTALFGTPPYLRIYICAYLSIYLV